MGGPSYEGIIFKYANNYFSIVICGYATYGGIEIFTFSGGLYMYKNIAAAL